jgi:rhamnose utilization protein RhaD (predicted bifunctional aldolase and dehydrogenase)
MTNSDSLLSNLTTLSHEFGGPDYVKGGGGNTSAKTVQTIWVKPSGTTLATLTPQAFLGMDRAKLGALYQGGMPTESAAREARVQELMAAAILPGHKGRPSVEAPLHDLLPGVFVVHNHPALINGLLCSRRAGGECARLFPEALWIPYVNPGFTLSLDVRRHVQEYERSRGKRPTVLMLENHGTFILGDSAESVRAEFANCFDKLRAEYRKANVPLNLQYRRPAAEAEVQEVRRKLQDLLGAEAAFAAYSPGFEVAQGPISPDHIVYAKSYAYDGPIKREGLQAFRDRWGYSPQVLVAKVGVFGLGNSQKKAQLALDLAQDGALVQQLAAAFGGIQLLTDAAREFIETWEVESYRQKQIQ